MFQGVKPGFEPVVFQGAVGEDCPHAIFAESGRVYAEGAQYFPDRRGGVSVPFLFDDDQLFQCPAVVVSQVMEAEFGVDGEAFRHLPVYERDSVESVFQLPGQ